MTGYEIFVNKETGDFVKHLFMENESINTDKVLTWADDADRRLYEMRNKKHEIPESINKYPLLPSDCFTEWELAHFLLNEALKALNYIHNTNLRRVSNTYKNTYELASAIGNFMKTGEHEKENTSNSTNKG